MIAIFAFLFMAGLSTCRLAVYDLLIFCMIKPTNPPGKGKILHQGDFSYEPISTQNENIG